MAAVASRSAYLGAAIFAAAAAAAMFVVLPSISVDLGRVDAPVTKILPLTMMGSAAGIAAALSFWTFDRLDLRLRRANFLLHSTALVASVVIFAHVLLGPLIAVLWSIEIAVTPGVILNGDEVVVALVAGIRSFYFLPVTLPIGIAAAVLAFWLEQRRPSQQGKME